MKITGLIAEFNPFHNGHTYVLTQARALSGCDFVVVAMSGDFVQRGAPALLDKSIRTKAALQNGADLVVALPALVSTGSARDFAYGGVKTLAACGVDTLAFGCECTDIALLQKMAAILHEEPATFKEVLQTALRNGKNYPSAQTEALLAHVKGAYSDTTLAELAHLLRQPNTILALEYLRAIRELQIPMKILPISRVGVSHHAQKATQTYASATHIRQMLLSGRPLTDFATVLPKNASLLYEDALTRQPLLSERDYQPLLPYVLRLQADRLPNFLDSSAEIANRLLRCLATYEDFDCFLEAITTKDVTRGKMMRILTHILLNLTTDQMHQYRREPIPYLRILGLRKDARPLLGTLSKHALVITSVAQAPAELPLLQSDLFARETYLALAQTKGDATSLRNDYRLPVQIF